jgi:hypothetical protein
MVEELERINERPEPFQFCTAKDLWTDEHTSKQMLSFHLNEAIDISSRNAEFINRSVDWIATEFNIGRDNKVIDFSKRSIMYATEVADREKLNITYVN